jgi:hypothetical protein
MLSVSGRSISCGFNDTVKFCAASRLVNRNLHLSLHMDKRREAGQLWDTGWTVGVRFPAEARDFHLLHNVQTGAGAHPAFSPMCTGVLFAGESGRGLKVTTHLHLVPRSRMVELYLNSLTLLHGVVLN